MRHVWGFRGARPRARLLATVLGLAFTACNAEREEPSYRIVGYEKKASSTVDTTGGYQLAGTSSEASAASDASGADSDSVALTELDQEAGLAEGEAVDSTTGAASAEQAASVSIAAPEGGPDADGARPSLGLFWLGARFVADRPAPGSIFESALEKPRGGRGVGRLRATLRQRADEGGERPTGAISIKGKTRVAVVKADPAAIRFHFGAIALRPRDCQGLQCEARVTADLTRSILASWEKEDFFRGKESFVALRGIRFRDPSGSRAARGLSASVSIDRERSGFARPEVVARIRHAGPAQSVAAVIYYTIAIYDPAAAAVSPVNTAPESCGEDGCERRGSTDSGGNDSVPLLSAWSYAPREASNGHPGAFGTETRLRDGNLFVKGSGPVGDTQVLQFRCLDPSACAVRTGIFNWQH